MWYMLVNPQNNCQHLWEGRSLIFFSPVSSRLKYHPNWLLQQSYIVPETRGTKACRHLWKDRRNNKGQTNKSMIDWYSGNPNACLHQQWLQVYGNPTTGCQNPRTPLFLKAKSIGDRVEQSKNMKGLWWQTIIIMVLITLYDIIFQWVGDNCTLIIIVTEISAEHEFYFFCQIIESATLALNVMEWSHPYPFYWVIHHSILALLASPGTLPNIMAWTYGRSRYRSLVCAATAALKLG